MKRIADAGGTISFAGASYRAGRSWARSTIDVAIVGACVQLSVDGKVIRVHPIRHDRAKEYGAYATPNGRPARPLVSRRRAFDNAVVEYFLGRIKAERH